MALVPHASNANERWHGLHPNLQKHIREILSYYLEGGRLPREVMKKYQKYNTEASDPASKADNLALALFDTLDPFGPLSLFADRITCYREDNDSVISLRGILRESVDAERGTGVAVMEGRIEGYERAVVVKWYKSDESDTGHEVSLYRAIREVSRTVLPWFSGSYLLWGHPLLVVEMLRELDNEDHEVDVGLDILSRLKQIHRVCLHCDIKPCNIVKDVKGERPVYYLIDFGQSTLLHERKGVGYNRRVHTNKYYRPGFKTMTTIKTELIELLITLKKIQRDREIKFNKSGPLYRYEKLLNEEPEDPDETIYDRLRQALHPASK